MLKRRSKKPAEVTESVQSRQTSSDVVSGASRSTSSGPVDDPRLNGTSTSRVTSSPPPVDDFDDTDLPIDPRMRRNLTVSRSGRYKSKSRPRAQLNQATGVPPAEGMATRTGTTAIPSPATSSTNIGTYNQVIASAAGPPMPSAYRGMTTAL